MADKVIGLDVGTNAVRAVALTLGDRPRLNLMGQVALPPGAMHEGEVIDVEAVANQVRRLWKQVGFGSKSVRVGMASARVILRVVDMPVLSEGDTRSALRFQLGEYVPLEPEATAFDFQPLSPASGDDGRRLLLAAAPRDAVQPLIDAVKQAGLKVSAVDVVPAALARAFAPPPSADPAVEAIVSIGAGTIVVVVARDGEPMFARTVTNVSGRHVTDRIATELSVPPSEAEHLKRQVQAEDVPDVGAKVQVVTDLSIAEICDEIGDSLDYYAAQPGSPPIDAVAVTGGGALLVGLPERLEWRLRLPVRRGDAFAHLDMGATGFEQEDLPFLSPYMAAAIGVALGAASAKGEQINLAPESAPLMARRRRPLLIGGLVAAAVVGGGYLLVHQGHALSDARASRSQLEQVVVSAREVAASQAAATQPAEAATASASVVLGFARTADVDWALVATQLDATGEPMGISITSLTGTATAPAAPAAGASTSAPAGSAAGAATTPTTVASTGAEPVAPAEPAAAEIGSVEVTGTAADLDAVAAWIDAVMADPHFSSAWVDSTTKTTTADGAAVVEFTASVSLTAEDLTQRPLLEDGLS